MADSVAPEARGPMADIAAVAAEALRARDFSVHVIRELLSPRDRTCAEVAAVIGAAIGQPELPYVQLPEDELRTILTEAAGFSADFAGPSLEFNRALGAGRLHSLEGRNDRNSTPAEFERFAAIELAGAYAVVASQYEEPAHSRWRQP
jgi:uncharacterized protein YbjT (DUF2867 family)